VVGSRIAGYVARDSLDTDVTQETDFATKAPKFNKDGSEMWQVTVPLDVAVSAEYPEGKGTWWAKGRGLKSFTREQAAKGYKPGHGLRQGDFVEVVRTADSPTTFGSPAHEFQVTITRRPEDQALADPTPATPPVSAPPAALPPSATPATPSLPTPPAAPAATTTPTPPAPTATPATTTVPAIPGLTPEQAAIVAQYTSQG
jgi:hypothetical protein